MNPMLGWSGFGPMFPFWPGKRIGGSKDCNRLQLGVGLLAWRAGAHEKHHFKRCLGDTPLVDMPMSSCFWVSRALAFGIVDINPCQFGCAISYCC